MARTLDDIVEALRRSKDRNMGCTLLLGAGCSKTAGIPLAGGIVDDIRKNPLYERVYKRALERARRERHPHAAEPTYGECMTEMEKGDQRELIRRYIDTARLNWAHAGIAALMKHGYIGRILTTNFDPLVARACSVFNELPGVYDLTMSDIRSYKELPDKAIFHLHGQRYGFSMLNNPDELDRHKKQVEPLFKHAREGRTWIVCGYSGENDPLFDLIRSCDEYDHALYWIGRETEPPKHLEPLFMGSSAKSCHYLQFAGADEFFFRLCGALDIADFKFMHRPLEHIEEILEQFVDFPSSATDSGIDLLTSAKASIDYYKSAYYTVSAQAAADQKISEMIASQGHTSAALAISNDPSLAAQASADLRAELKILEGGDLFKKAKYSNDSTEAVKLYGKAIEYCQSALAIKPDLYIALYNWGHSLVRQAEFSQDLDASHLLAEAQEKYLSAITINPNDQEGFYCLANLLVSRAKRASEIDSDHFLAEAYEKYASAVAIKPDMHDALHDWAIALAYQARRKSGPEAHSLFSSAYEKYASVLKIKPDSSEALFNWGIALAAQANLHSDSDAQHLLIEACEKYASALAIKPDFYDALNNWAAILCERAHRSDHEKRLQLLHQAVDKAMEHETLAPGSGAYNLACAYAMLGDVSQMTDWLNRSFVAGKLPGREKISTDKDFNTVRDTAEFKAWWAKMGWAD